MIVKLRAGGFRRNEEGALEIGKSLGIAFTIVGAVLAALIIASLAPQYIGAVANTSTAVSSTDFGDATANSLRAPMAMIVAIGGLAAVVLLALGAIALKKS